jgi:heme exporter protein C
MATRLATWCTLPIVQKHWFFLLFALSIVCFYMCLHGIFFVAPTEAKMGIVQKIFYFHVPAAYAMYLCASICFLGSAHYLARGGDWGDVIAKAAAEITVLFGAIVVVTGPLWARKAWGAYWTWDPRLTTTLLALVIYVAYLFLRTVGGNGEVEKRFAAVLGVLGIADLPIIHFSVQRWSGQHPTVITQGGGGLDGRMIPPLVLGFLTFTFVSFLLIWLRARTDLFHRRLAEVQMQADDLAQSELEKS